MMYVVEQSCIVRSRVQTFVTATMSHTRTGCDGVLAGRKQITPHRS